MAEPSPLSILDLADPETIERVSQRGDHLGALMRSVRGAADPDAEFQRIISDSGLLREIQVKRRQQILALALAFGTTKANMKKYLAAAGLVNDRD